MKSWFSVFLGLFLGTTFVIPSHAQIIPDGTANTLVFSTGNRIGIGGGNVFGGNLFHSFADFSISNGTEAFFNNTSNIANIFARVTGGNIAELDGLIRTNGNANLFLINPNGLIWGENSALDLGGSFLGSSTDSLLFANGTKFSATNIQAPPLLSILPPIGLEFGDSPGAIVNRSVNGLQVQSTETLALVGGDISFEQGNLSADNGSILLGSVAGNNLVNLNTAEPRLSLDFSEVRDFRDISLDNSSLIMSGENGEIQIVGRKVELKDSQILANSGSTVSIQAEQLIITPVTSSIPEPSGKVGLFVLISFQAFSAIVFRKRTVRQNV